MQPLPTNAQPHAPVLIVARLSPLPLLQQKGVQGTSSSENWAPMADGAEVQRHPSMAHTVPCTHNPLLLTTRVALTDVCGSSAVAVSLRVMGLLTRSPSLLRFLARLRDMEMVGCLMR